MAKCLKLFCFYLIFVHGFYSVYGKRLREDMYTAISGASCIRRLNGTHQTGCSSNIFGTVGALHLVNVEEDFEFFYNNPPAPPYAAMIPPHLFTRKQMLRLKNEALQNVSVVLLINHTKQMTSFSHELSCPNQYSGLQLPNATTCDADGIPGQLWNPFGTGLLHEDFPFPIYFISDEDEITKLTSCFETFNNFDYAEQAHRSLCAIEINAFMSAAVNSEVCIRRTNFLNSLNHMKHCDPLEGRNIFGTLFPRKIVEYTMNENDYEDLTANVAEIDQSERFILVTCRIDTTSMFDGVALGMLDSLLSYATLISTAHTLARLLPEQKANQTNVLFMIFNGESYDYIGSQRLVFDIEKQAFPAAVTHRGPISLSQIDLMLDIGVLDDISKIRLHYLQQFPQATQILNRLNNYAKIYNFGINIEAAAGIHLPPTSAQSFLRKNQSFPALVFNSAPTNKYYHSIYDDSLNVNYTYANTSQDFYQLMELNDASNYFGNEAVQMRIRNISTILALALYESVSGSAYKGTKIANPLFADELLYCFLMSADCALFKAASPPLSVPGIPLPPPRYISVYGSPQEAAGWTYRILGYVLSQPQPLIKEEQCTSLPLNFIAGFDGKGECRLTTQNYSVALSPAFLIDNYDWSSGKYSTWTESTWRQFSARIFLRPSDYHQYTVFSIGITMLIISILIVYLISKRADVLFEMAPSSSESLTAPTAC